MCMVLHEHSHGHGHGHSHGGGGRGHRRKKEKTEQLQLNDVERNGDLRGKRRDRRRRTEQHQNINVRAAFIHVIGDLIQSIGVVIAGYVIWFRVRIVQLHYRLSYTHVHI